VGIQTYRRRRFLTILSVLSPVLQALLVSPVSTLSASPANLTFRQMGDAA